MPYEEKRDTDLDQVLDIARTDEAIIRQVADMNSKQVYAAHFRSSG